MGASSSKSEKMEETEETETLIENGLHLSFDETVLTESAAWTIAMAWSSSLACQSPWGFPVQLETESDPDNRSIVESYAWVMFTRNRRNRGDSCWFATVVWFWLSCCAGYSGRENPRFWKRVFAELVRQPEHFPRIADRKVKSVVEITDAIRFFDLPGCEFPRVRFDSQLTSQIISDVHPWAENGVDEAKLKAIFKKLHPFLLPDRLERAIQVSVPESQLDAVCTALTTQNPPYEGDIVAYWPKFEAVAKVSSVIRVPLPEDSAPVTADVRVLMGIQPPTAEQKYYSEVQLTRDLLGDRVLECACSALPHATHVKTISLTLPPPRVVGHTFLGPRYEPAPYPPYSRADWAWLGYALFHPSAKTSSWRHLRISLDGITQDCVSAMRLMSIGNNLHTVDRINSSTSTKYRTARLRRGAQVREDPTDSASVLVQLDHDSHVALCDDSTVVPGDWARLIVPGVGLGWVHSSDICDIEVCDPNGPELESLSIDFGDTGTLTPEQVSTVLDFVGLVGANITYLDVMSCGYLDEQSLRGVLLSCPRLQILRVEHDGTIWSRGDVDSLPQLKELCIAPFPFRYRILDVERKASSFQRPSKRALETAFRELAVLRLIDSFEGSRDSVCSLLRESTSLRYFHWCDTFGVSNRAKMKGYDEGLRFTYSALGLESDDAIRDAHRYEAQSKRRLAFLSVVHAAQEHSVMAKLPSEVLRNIFTLNDGVQRELWVDWNRERASFALSD